MDVADYPRLAQTMPQQLVIGHAVLQVQYCNVQDVEEFDGGDAIIRDILK